MKYEEFIKSANEILKDVDFDKLDSSCNGADKSYATEILNMMHKAFRSIYGEGEPVSDNEGMIDVPAVIRGRETGHMAIGLVFLDLDSSCEHWGTDFFTPFGVLTHGSSELRPEEKVYLQDMFVPYDYWYKPSIDGDIHVDFDNVPDDVKKLLDGGMAASLHMASPKI